MKGILHKRLEVRLTAIKRHTFMSVAHHCETLQVTQSRAEGLLSHHFLLPPPKQKCTKGQKVHLKLLLVLHFSSALFPSQHLAHTHTHTQHTARTI